MDGTVLRQSPQTQQCVLDAPLPRVLQERIQNVLSALQHAPTDPSEYSEGRNLNSNPNAVVIPQRSLNKKSMSRRGGNEKETSESKTQFHLRILKEVVDMIHEKDEA